ncbi:cell division cycle-associated protein 4 [Ranitomeya variabilis]|uniref:cell division cycle-associated protein 4 n=1 Tax=Ranitomeya variabilis TaxID=490064 RepID=UPI0040562360
MFTRGIKRKSLDPDVIDSSLVVDLKSLPSYTLERQSMLDMSLVKLQLCHMLVEPNLCRSVLIANTVRQIQEEMTQDGSWQFFHVHQTDHPAPLDRLVSTEILCRSSKDQAEEKRVDNSYVTYSEELEVQETQEISEVSAVTSVKATQNTSTGFWEIEGPQENRANLQKSLDHIFETLENRSTNSMEDLFSEVDTSYYDLDTVLTGMMGNSKLGHCDVLESLSQTAAATHCKSELNEIDHIVEILVES